MPFLVAGGRETYTDANHLHTATTSSDLAVSSNAKAFLVIESGTTLTSFKKDGDVLITVPSTSPTAVGEQIITLSGKAIDSLNFIVFGTAEIKVFELF